MRNRSPDPDACQAIRHSGSRPAATRSTFCAQNSARRRNVPGGGLVACRVPTDHVIVCGISNWGAYGLAAGVRLLRGAPPTLELFDRDREREFLRLMVEEGPLVDGVLGRQVVSVDGIDFHPYSNTLRRLGERSMCIRPQDFCRPAGWQSPSPG